MMWVRLVLCLAFALAPACAVARAQQTSTVTSDDAQVLGLDFSAAPGWRQGLSDPFSATTNAHGVSLYFYTELYSAASAGVFDTQTTEDVIRAKWSDSEHAQFRQITAASADGVEVEWPGSRIERWFRVSNDRFVVERCMANGVSASVWASVARAECDAQFNAVVITESTLPPAYRAAEPVPGETRATTEPPARKVPNPALARIPGGQCATAGGASETAKAASLVRHGERAESQADQFACWEAASQLGSADAMTKIGQMFLERDQMHQSEQDRMAGVVWLLVAADRYNTLLRATKDAEAKTRYKQRMNTIMDLVAALKSEKLTLQQFDSAVTEASNWKKANMQLFR
jgi:hypothetical protein